MLFLVKVRLDVNKLGELGQPLQAGSLPTHPVGTYCLQEDPALEMKCSASTGQTAQIVHKLLQASTRRV